MTRLNARDFFFRYLRIVGSIEKEEWTCGWLEQSAYPGPVKHDRTVDFDSVCHCLIRDACPHAKTNETDGSGTGLMQGGRALSDIVIRATTRQVMELRGKPCGIAPSRPMKEIRGDGRAIRSGELLTKAQDEWGHPSTLHQYDDAPPRQVRCWIRHEVWNWQVAISHDVKVTRLSEWDVVYPALK
jgi:hypothetical protein